MSFEVFRKLSIHYVDEDARTISVVLSSYTKTVSAIRNSNSKKRKLLSSSVLPSQVDVPLSTTDKAKFHLKGDFRWGDETSDGRYVTAQSSSWHCPFDEHGNNRQVVVSSCCVFCFACQKTFHFFKRQRNEELETSVLETKKEFIVRTLRAGGRFNHFFESTKFKRLTKNHCQQYLGEFVLTSAFHLQRQQKEMELGKEYIVYNGNRCKTSASIRDLLYKKEYIGLEECWSALPEELPTSNCRPLIEGRSVSCGASAPAFAFGKVFEVQAAERERCPWKVICNSKTIQIILSMGCGKTKALIDFFSTYEQLNKSVLVIVGRKSFGKGFFKDLQKAEPWLQSDEKRFVYYRTADNKRNHSAQNAPRVVTCLNSLQRILNGRSGSFDFVVLDEVLLLLECFNAPTMKDKRTIWNLLSKVCSDAKHLIVMDADMKKTSQAEWFLKEVCQRENITKLDSNAKTDNRKYLEISPNEDFYAVVKEMVGKGLKVAICSNTATEIRNVHGRLEETFPDKKGLAIYNQVGHRYESMVINGETRSFDKDEDTKDLNWFAFSPSISPGCSIADPFDVLIAYSKKPGMVWNAFSSL
jgi:hypothetical protein